MQLAPSDLKRAGSSKSYQFKVRLTAKASSMPKMFGRFIPIRFLLFSLVGGSGVAVHLATLKLLLTATSFDFPLAQAFATLVAAISNFFLNNWVTYRDRRLHGWSVLTGLMSFLLVCSVGAAVNVAFAEQVFLVTKIWWLAGIAGAAVSSILNYSATALFTWRKK